MNRIITRTQKNLIMELKGLEKYIILLETNKLKLDFMKTHNYVRNSIELLLSSLLTHLDGMELKDNKQGVKGSETLQTNLERIQKVTGLQVPKSIKDNLTIFEYTLDEYGKDKKLSKKDIQNFTQLHRGIVLFCINNGLISYTDLR